MANTSQSTATTHGSYRISPPFILFPAARFMATRPTVKAFPVFLDFSFPLIEEEPVSVDAFHFFHTQR